MRNRMPSTRRIEIREAADTTALSKYENNRHAICSKYSFLRSKFPSRTLQDPLGSICDGSLFLLLKEENEYYSLSLTILLVQDIHSAKSNLNQFLMMGDIDLSSDWLIGNKIFPLPVRFPALLSFILFCLRYLNRLVQFRFGADLL